MCFSRYNDDEKDLIILRNYKKQYKDARTLFDREVEKVELIKEVIIYINTLYTETPKRVL